MPQNFDLFHAPETAALLKNKAALQAILSSPETRQLMSALSQQNGNHLKDAAQKAKQGDLSSLSAMVSNLAASPQGNQLIEKLQSSLPK